MSETRRTEQQRVDESAAIRVFAERDVARLDHLLEARDRVFDRRDDAPERVDQVRQGTVSSCRRKPLLALEVIVKRGLGHAGRLDNFADRRRLVAPIRKQPGSHPCEMPGHRAHLSLGRHRRLGIDSGAHVITLKSMKATTLPNGRYCGPIGFSESTSVE